LFQDWAVIRGLAGLTLLDETLQGITDSSEIVDLLSHRGQFRTCMRFDGPACRDFIDAKPEQFGDFGEGEAKLLGPADEAKSIDSVGRIVSVTGFGTRRFFK